MEIDVDSDALNTFLTVLRKGGVSNAARALHRHLCEDWGLADPRVAILVSPALCPSRSLVIGVSRSGLIAKGATDNQIAGWMERIRWFLPPSRGLMLMPDGWSASEVTSLSELF